MTKAFNVVGMSAIHGGLFLALRLKNGVSERGREIEKGIMQLIDMPARSTYSGSVQGPGQEVSGGSAAIRNSGDRRTWWRDGLCGARSMTTNWAIIFAMTCARKGLPTDKTLAPQNGRGREPALHLWSPPMAKRRLNTYLGVTEFLTPDDIGARRRCRCEWIYLEATASTGPIATRLLPRQSGDARGTAVRSSLTLSDPFLQSRATRRVPRDDPRRCGPCCFVTRPSVGMVQSDEFRACAQPSPAEGRDFRTAPTAKNGCYVHAGAKAGMCPPIRLKSSMQQGLRCVRGAFSCGGITHGADLADAGRNGQCRGRLGHSAISDASGGDLTALFKEQVWAKRV